MKKADYILKSSGDIQSLYDTLVAFYPLSKSKANFKLSFDSHVYWDTLYHKKLVRLGLDFGVKV